MRFLGEPQIDVGLSGAVCAAIEASVPLDTPLRQRPTAITAAQWSRSDCASKRLRPARFLTDVNMELPKTRAVKFLWRHNPEFFSPQAVFIVAPPLAVIMPMYFPSTFYQFKKFFRAKCKLSLRLAERNLSFYTRKVQNRITQTRLSPDEMAPEVFLR